jgi:hypothetical protein
MFLSKIGQKTPLGIITGEDLNVKEMDPRENGRPKMLVKHNYDTGYSLFRQRLIRLAKTFIFCSVHDNFGGFHLPEFRQQGRTMKCPYSFAGRA